MSAENQWKNTDLVDESTSETTLLEVEDLMTHIHTERGTVRAVDGVSFDINRGETVCIVGESGSGKSVTCESLTRIISQPPAEIKQGRVTFDGTQLLDISEKEIRSIRGNRIAHVFQNPQSALDPVYTIGKQVVEAITIHEELEEDDARQRAIDLLRKVGISRAHERIDEYPHEFSGGMQQRAAIAIALAADPELLIADEPTTAVDVTVQARLIELLRGLSNAGMSMLWITHDLRVVAAIADRVIVMYGGTIVEEGPIKEVFTKPAHPYTQALFESYHGLADDSGRPAREHIPGDGCRFRGQCRFAVDECAGGNQPAFASVPDSSAHQAACVYYHNDRDPTQILEEATDARPIAPEVSDD